MKNLEDMTAAIQALSEGQSKSVELQAAYYTELGKQVTEGVAELAEQSLEHLETVTNARSFISAFEVNVEFEDSVTAKVSDFYQHNAEATKTLINDITKLFEVEGSEATAAPTKAAKATSKKTAKQPGKKAA
jgi:hypothetical protein